MRHNTIIARRESWYEPPLLMLLWPLYAIPMLFFSRGPLHWRRVILFSAAWAALIWWMLL